MEIILTGLSHKKASVDVRGKLAFDARQASVLLEQLKERFPGGEFVLLSTCNRVELYGAVNKDPEITAGQLGRLLADFHNVDYEDFREFFYILKNRQAVEHLLTVACSLDSMVVGEAQIFSQVKESYSMACGIGSTGKVLNKLFHESFSTGKKIYSETNITTRRTSVAGVAVKMARDIFGNIRNAKITVIGAGKMGKLIIEHFLHIKCENITLINRSFDKACLAARKHGISAKKWELLDEYMCNSDIVVAAAAMPYTCLFNKDSFVEIIAKRNGQKLLIIDIAVPRNFAPSINEIENVYVYNIDDLSRVVQENIQLRQNDVELAQTIISEKTAEFMDWFARRDIGPAIGLMKEVFDEVGQKEIRRILGAEYPVRHKEEIEQVTSRIVNKLSHCVIENINLMAREWGADEAAKLVDGIIAHAKEAALDGNQVRKE